MFFVIMFLVMIIYFLIDLVKTIYGVFVGTRKFRWFLLRWGIVIFLIWLIVS